MLEAQNYWDLPEQDHQGNEEGAGVHIVVEGQGPDIAVYSRHHLKQNVQYSKQYSVNFAVLPSW